MPRAADVVLMLGSGPEVTDCRKWPRPPFQTIVAINNAWRVRPDWDFLIHPDDFPPDRQPSSLDQYQCIVTSDVYIPAQNSFGGVVYAGGTMAFTAGYWAIEALRPRVLAYMGCNMVYQPGKTSHFYGKGTADPLRPDVTLQNLEAKSARLMIHAARRGVSVVNLSRGESRLLFPRYSRHQLATGLVPELPQYDQAAAQLALWREAGLGYHVASGRYWEEESRFDRARLAEIDGMWHAAAAAHFELAELTG